MGDKVLRGVTLADGATVDVRIGRAEVTAVSAVSTVPRQPGDDDADLTGHVLVTAAVEPHAHLDKAFLAERVVNRTGDLLGAIEAMVAARPVLTMEDTAERAERAARLFAANGYRVVRTHVDTTLDHGLR